MREVLWVIAMLALAGCAPTIPVLVVSPGPEPGTQFLPPSEVVDERAVRPRDGTGAIVVTTQARAGSASGCIVDVALDSDLVAGLRPGEQVVLFAEPGQRTVSLSVRDEAACRPASAQVALDVVEHTTQRIDVGSDSRHDLRVEAHTYGRSLPR